MSTWSCAFLLRLNHLFIHYFICYFIRMFNSKKKCVFSISSLLFLLSGLLYFTDLPLYASTINVSTSRSNIISITQSSGTISGNIINVSGSPTINGWVTTGVSWGSANITLNTVNVSGGTFYSFVSGSYATNGISSYNTVTVTGGEFHSNIHGGVSINGNAFNNTVTITGANVVLHGGAIRGGTTNNGSSYNNTITITNADISGNIVTGGYAGAGLVNANTVTLTNVSTDGDTFVYAGHSITSGNATNNILNITDSTLASGSQVFAGSADSGDVSNNKTTVSGGTIEGSVVGGESIYGTVSQNSVLITGNSTFVDGLVMGGESIDSGNVINNTVTINNGTFDGTIILGARTETGTASNNTVTINDGIFENDTTSNGYNTRISGGQSRSGTSSGNIVNILGGIFTTDTVIYGGNTFTGSVTLNTVNVEGGTFGSGSLVAGAYAQTGTVTSNTVNISGGTFETGSIISGAYSESSDISTNTVNVAGGTFGSGSLVAGGYAQTGTVISNTVNVSDGTFEAGSIVTGAYSESSDISTNTVNTTGGTFETGSILTGGYSGSGTVTNNTLTLSSSATYNGYVFAGYTDTGTVTNNNINITTNLTGLGVISAGGASSSSATITNNSITIASPDGVTGSLDLGGVSLSGYSTTSLARTTGTVTASNNTLIVKSEGTNINDVSNFDSFVFYVNDLSQDHRIQANTIDLGTDATISVYLLDSSVVLTPGENIELFKTPQTTDIISGNIGEAHVYQGVSLVTDLMIDIGPAGNIRNLIVGATTANSLARTFPEARLASFAFVNQADDLILGQGIASAIEMTNLRLNKWVTFGALDIGTSSYTTESDLTGDISFGGISMVTGLSRKTPFGKSNLLSGVYLEAGTGFIDTENFNENLESIETGGSSNYYGVGLFGRYDFGNGIYIGALARYGVLATDFTTEDSMTNLEYSANTPYYGLGVSTGYQFNVFQNRDAIDLYGRYMWTQLAEKNMIIDGQEYDFKAINSHQVRVGGQYNFNHRRKFSPFIGLAAQYDFDGEAEATIRKLYPTSTPQLQGLTGLFEAGVRFKPTTIEDIPLSLSMNFEGFVGRRRGASMTLDVEYSF